MQVAINFQNKSYTLTDECAASAAPVLISPTGEIFRAWDNVIDNPNARASGGERYHFQVAARAVASYAKDDHPNDAAVLALLAAFNSVPDPELPKG